MSPLPAIAVTCATLTMAVLAAPAASAPARIFVTSQDDASVSEIEAGQDHVTVRQQLAQGPAGIASDAAGQRIVVTHPDAAAIDVIDVATRRPQTLKYVGEPFGVAVTGKYIFVSDWARDQVVRLNGETGRIVDVVGVGKSPAGLAIDRARNRLYVANRESGGISVIDGATMHVLASTPTGTAPFALAIAPDGKRLYVANVRSNDLAVIDTDGMKTIARIATASMPYGVAVTPDNALILVSNQHANSVSVIDAASLRVLATIPVGRYPEGVTAVDGRAYVANWFSGDVSVIDLKTLREATRIKVGDGPRNFAVVQDPGEAR